MNRISIGKVLDILVRTEDKFYMHTTSKGNQMKWKTHEGLWVKKDDVGYEGLSEAISSSLLESTNARELGYSWAEYSVCMVTVKSEGKENSHTGCYSPNFLKEGETLITLDSLFKRTKDYETIGEDFYNRTMQGNIEWVVDIVTSLTGISNFGQWLTFLLEFDQLILNEDRHFNNIGIIDTGKGYKPMPIFDNGLSLFSDMRGTYQDWRSMEDNYQNIISKPFSKDFEVQVGLCRDLYGRQLRLDLTEDDIPNDYLYDLDIYSKEILDRVTTVLKKQVSRYPFGNVDKKDMNLDWI